MLGVMTFLISESKVVRRSEMNPEELRVNRRTNPTSLHALLKSELDVRFNRDLQIGRLQFVVVRQPQNCEGIATPETDEDYRNNEYPFSPDFYVRGFCGPRILMFGEVAIRQTKKYGFEYPLDRTCCLRCARDAGVLLLRSK